MVAETVSSNLRVFDFACRWGGDEFVAVVANVDKADLLRIAERLRTLVEKISLSLGGEVIWTTLSIGATMARRVQALQRIENMPVRCADALRQPPFVRHTD